MAKQKLIFMGTPDFAAQALRALIEADYEISLVVTQPDRPKGRSGALQPSPVKEVAVKAGIPVFQPERIKRPENVEELRKYPADLFVVAAFGQILSTEILTMAPGGCVNIHASILPKYRGASPIQNVLLNGEPETGITIMQMDEGIDTGDILYVKKIPIAADDNCETLSNKLEILGGEAILEALPLLAEGGLTAIPQDHEKSCYAPLLGREMGELDFHNSAESILNKIRALNPWPSAYTFVGDKQLKIWRAETADCDAKKEPGCICNITKKYFDIATGDGRVLRVLELQMEGKKRMETSAFLLGVHFEVGDKLGR